MSQCFWNQFTEVEFKDRHAVSRSSTCGCTRWGFHVFAVTHYLLVFKAFTFVCWNYQSKQIFLKKEIKSTDYQSGKVSPIIYIFQLKCTDDQGLSDGILDPSLVFRGLQESTYDWRRDWSRAGMPHPYPFLLGHTDFILIWNQKVFKYLTPCFFRRFPYCTFCYTK